MHGDLVGEDLHGARLCGEVRELSGGEIANVNEGGGDPMRDAR